MIRTDTESLVWRHKDLLDLEDLDRDEIELVLDTAKGFKEISGREVKKVPALRGRTVGLLFFEPSTRTRASFELAAKRLSADTVTFSSGGSSLSKGETVVDTVRNLEAMNIDICVVRHRVAGVPHMIGRVSRAGVVNAGDGCRAHPTQALLDVFTIKEHFGRIEGLTVTLVGDIAHSRVARSNIRALIALGARVKVCGPATMMPAGLEGWGVDIHHDLDEVIPESDVLMMLRIQKERHTDPVLPSLREYASRYGLTAERLRHAKDHAVVMHPGPTNRGVEIAAEVADGPRSLILKQVNNGLAVRMAVLFLISSALSRMRGETIAEKEKRTEEG